MREKEIEKNLVDAVKRRGGVCLKWASPGFDGVPDRIVMFPLAKIGFIEVKAPGKKVRPLQESRHRLLRGLGFKVYVIDGVEQIPSVLDEIGDGTVGKRGWSDIAKGNKPVRAVQCHREDRSGSYGGR